MSHDTVQKVQAFLKEHPELEGVQQKIIKSVFEMSLREKSTAGHYAETCPYKVEDAKRTAHHGVECMWYTRVMSDAKRLQTIISAATRETKSAMAHSVEECPYMIEDATLTPFHGGACRWYAGERRSKLAAAIAVGSHHTQRAEDLMSYHHVNSKKEAASRKAKSLVAHTAQECPYISTDILNRPYHGTDCQFCTNLMEHVGPPHTEREQPFTSHRGVHEIHTNRRDNSRLMHTAAECPFVVALADGVPHHGSGCIYYATEYKNINSSKPAGLAAPVTIPPSSDPGEKLLRYFAYEHLPPHLQAVSIHFSNLAGILVRGLPACAERTVTLRKLLEAKDCAVRAALDDWGDKK